MLMGGDESLLAAPVANFRMELGWIALPRGEFQALPPAHGLPQQTFDGELEDLRSALAQSPGGASPGLLDEFTRVRRSLQGCAEALEEWRQWQVFRGDERSPAPRPVLPAVNVPSGLPVEFREYLSGSVAFYQGDTNAAQGRWRGLLELPASERHYRSTWAAFMLGKTTPDPGQAISFFAQVRALAKAGFADSLGLAASSYGWEARVEGTRGNYAEALRLYLLQHQTGDGTALESLRMTLRKVLALPVPELARLADVPVAQQIITAYINSRQTVVNEGADSADLIRLWLQAVEASRAREIDSADRLALAAYQRGLFDLAQNWLARARPDSALGQWLKAKMLLRAGDLAGAARLLSQTVRLFARDGTWPTPPVLEGEEPGSRTRWDAASPLRQAMGELGVVHLARREYYQALDTLLRSGYWSDAAYVAEYVLTPDELMAYVDRQWPQPETDADRPAAEELASGDGFVQPDRITVQIRYLTGRRLARLQRWDEAEPFFPAPWQARLQAYVQALTRGRDPQRSAAERAQALWEAARMARHQGMELFGTEVEPDWHLHEGQYDRTHVSRLRAGAMAARAAAPETIGKAGQGTDISPPAVPLAISASSRDEQRRLAEHAFQPPRRFHYRYLAAELAWEAARLMPDQEDETARVLWQAGTWLKARDPQAADRFYKALVRRCGRTALGKAADERRWFPPTATPE